MLTLSLTAFPLLCTILTVDTSLNMLFPLLFSLCIGLVFIVADCKIMITFLLYNTATITLGWSTACVNNYSCPDIATTGLLCVSWRRTLMEVGQTLFSSTLPHLKGTIFCTDGVPFLRQVPNTYFGNTCDATSSTTSGGELRKGTVMIWEDSYRPRILRCTWLWGQEGFFFCEAKASRDFHKRKWAQKVKRSSLEMMWLFSVEVVLSQRLSGKEDPRFRNC